MGRLNSLTDVSLGVISLLAGGVVGLVGVLVVVLGLLGFAGGMHGGVVAASLITLFGAGLSLVGFYAARYGYRTMHHKAEAPSAPEDNVAT